MMFKAIRFSILFLFIFCGTAFSQINFQSNVIDLVNLSNTVTGTIPAPIVTNNCLLSEEQYRIEFPGGPRKLMIDLNSDKNVLIHVRRASPVAIEDGRIVSD